MRSYFGALHQALENQYADCDCESCKNTRIELSIKNDSSFTEKLHQSIKKALNTLYKKESYQPDDLLQVPEFRAVVENMSRLFSSTIPHETPQEMKAYLEKDAFVFSGLKTHTQLTEARQYLKDEKGNIVPFHTFQEKVLKLNEKYNKNYLEAEYQFAISSSQSAANWANLQEDTERYWLEYHTAGDEKVRQSHAILNGICLPKTDAFWEEFYPPNGWRCRCIAVEVLAGEKTHSDSQKAMEAGQKATTQIGANGKNKLEMFRFNAGVEKKMFPPNNAYSKVVGAKQVKKALENKIKKSENTQFTPKEIEKYEDTLKVKIDRRIFEHLKKETPLLFTNPKGISSSGAYYSPFYNAVKVPIDTRRKLSKWYAEAVIYHEFGHAADNHIGLRKNPIITDLMRKYIKIIDFKSIDKRLIGFQQYAFRRKNYDLLEKVGAVRDTIMALNPNYGIGHTKAYYKKSGNKEAEFIAHAFENTYAGNEVFKKVMPELYEEMINLVKSIKPK